ncbi:MAG: Hsp33 family molecular chaperone HslO [Aquificae bacterium]|nr:Hsp33 family molecular chaperone HslO [Aquificota bacterium]
MLIKKLDEQVKKDLKDYFQERDYMVIAVPKKEPVRVYALKATNTVETARRVHDLSPGAAVAMGRAIAGALLLTSLLKHGTNQKLLLKIEGDGPIGTIVVEADAKGRVRGFVQNPDVPLYTREENGKVKVDVARIVGKNGTLTVVKDLGTGKPYTGVVPLISGEIGKDIAYYLYQSEQIPSAVAVGVKLNEDGSVRHAGGYLVQTLGGSSDKVKELLEKRVLELPSPTEMFEQGLRPEDVATEILKDMEPQLVGLKEVEYYCPCDEEVAKASLLMLSEDELKELFKEQELATVSCRFCGKVYKFDEKVIEEKKKKGEDEKKKED